MTLLRVTPEQLSALSGRVSGGASSIEAELRGLAGAIAPLGSDWAGVAQAQFQTLWAEWQKSAESLQHALAGIAGLLAKAGEAYASAESAVAASFRGP